MAATHPTLFSWNDFEQTTPELQRFELAKEYLPDAGIIKALNDKRGGGRDDFPVEAMWNALLAGVVFQHPSIASLLRELSRNPALLQVCGFDPLPRQKRPVPQLRSDSGKVQVLYPEPFPVKHVIPSDWNFSRFLNNVIELEEDHQLVSGMVNRLREQLMEALPDFGEHLGYDGKAIDSHSSGHINKKTGKTSDPDADWGKHETTGVNHKTQDTWSKVKTWFGYGLHLIADTQYEIPVAFQITPASHSEHVELSAMMESLFDSSPALQARCQDFSADRGLDSGPTKAKLWDDYRIRPLIDTRELWREEKQAPDYDPGQPITRPLNPERADNIIHTEKGNVFCVCPDTSEHRPLAFQGFESDRNTLKYRCPAAAYGIECSGKQACHKIGEVSPGEYGRIVRIDITEQNRRSFVPTPHGSPSWKRGYNRRSALERINSRIDNSFGFENHYIRGLSKMKTRTGLALAVMMAMALGHVKAGRKEQMRSLVQPIPFQASG